MTYFPDGSSYAYGPESGEDRSRLVNVGWLSADHAYVRGEVPNDLTTKLARLCRHGINRMRGFHVCEFCPEGPADRRGHMTFARDEVGEFLVGSAEIRVPESGQRVFAALDMIIHYVTEHGYKPPDDFLRAPAEMEALA